MAVRRHVSGHDRRQTGRSQHGRRSGWLLDDFTELAEARGIDRQSARRLVNRTQWRRQKDNQGIVRVYVPFGREGRQRREMPARTSADTPAVITADVTADISRAITVLETRAEVAERVAHEGGG